MIAAIHDFVTSRRGFFLFVTGVLVTLWLVRAIFNDTPRNGDFLPVGTIAYSQTDKNFLL